MRINAERKEKIFNDFLNKINSIRGKFALSKKISEQELKDKERP